jgi:drug/metabolite transporter (DMT)-like permease
LEPPLASNPPDPPQTPTSTTPPQEEGSNLPPNVGDAWAVASAICFAFQMFVAEKHMRALPAKSELPLMAVSMLTVAALTSTAAAAAHAGDLPATVHGLQTLVADWQAALPAALGGGAAVPAAEAAEAARTLQQLLYTAVFSTDLVLFVELVALQNVSSTDAAMIYSMEPLVGALLAYAFLGERWGLWGWAGGAVILAASMATQMSGASEGEAAAPEAGGEGAAESGAVPAVVVARRGD